MHAILTEQFYASSNHMRLAQHTYIHTYDVKQQQNLFTMQTYFDLTIYMALGKTNLQTLFLGSFLPSSAL